MFTDYPALLITKLHIPPARSGQVQRAELLARLDAGRDRRLILIAAAAGFGKTSLISAWSQPYADQVAWLSLDTGDNDPARFFSYLIATIQVLRPTFGENVLAALQSPQPPPIDHILPILINQLASEKLILVLDDYHLIENPAIHTALTFLLDHLPPQITLVMLTRTDPPLPLPRLRVRNDLLEIRAADLRFSLDETTHLLNEMLHLNLSPASLRALDTRTEGWIAGLQLAALAMQSTPDHKAAFIEQFSGSHRFILDYLVEEVLAQQPAEIRQFLLHTSILQQMNGALCAAVAGAGQVMLEHLEKNNLFLIPLDQARQWYRYHHLFADLLHARLTAEAPALIPELYQRAARWHAQNENAETAVDYALAARDFDFAAELITGDAASVSRRGEVTTLLRWYQAFPPAVIAHRPRLCVQFVVAFALHGRWENAAKLLQEVGTVDELPPETQLLAQWITGQNLQAITAADAAKLEPAAQIMVGVLISVGGDLVTACEVLAKAQVASERAGDRLLALSAMFQQCRLNVFLGNLRRTYELSHAALQAIQDSGGAAASMATFAHSALGRVHLEWNELDQAAYHLHEAIRLSQLSGFLTGVISSTTIMLAEVRQAQGDPDGALDLAQQALRHAEHYDPPAEVAALRAYVVRIRLAQGRHSPEWTPHPGASIFYAPQVQVITLARHKLAQRKTEEAIALIIPLTTTTHLWRSEALGVLALARQANGDITHALIALHQMLDHAAPENHLRAFLDLGVPMAKLLARFLEDHPDHVFARQILGLFPADQDAGMDVLSERELAILRLIVAGHSNEEIAQTLSLALSTVKWYINGIYGKLHVKSRSQAIARAHALRLIEH